MAEELEWVESWAGQATLVAKSYSAVTTVLADDTRFSTSLLESELGGALGGTVLALDGAGHRALRRELADLFEPARVESRYRSVARDHANALTELLGREPAVDLVTRYAARLPALVLADVLGFGAERSNRLALLSRAVFAFGTRPTHAVAAMRAVERVVDAAVDDARKGAFDEGSLVAEIATRLDPARAVSCISLLVLAGIETTARALSTVLGATLSFSGVRTRVAADPSAELPLLVDEILRWEAPVTGVVRVTTADTELRSGNHVVGVPAGTAVLADLRAANHDRAIFPNPARVDLHNVAAGRHVAFGWGVHRCLGMHLARAELVEGVAAVLAVMPDATVLDAGPVEGHLVRSVRRLVVSPTGG
jgi:cytochrome P450